MNGLTISEFLERRFPGQLHAAAADFSSREVQRSPSRNWTEAESNTIDIYTIMQAFKSFELVRIMTSQNIEVGNKLIDINMQRIIIRHLLGESVRDL